MRGLVDAVLTGEMLPVSRSSAINFLAWHWPTIYVLANPFASWCMMVRIFEQYRCSVVSVKEVPTGHRRFCSVRGNAIA